MDLKNIEKIHDEELINMGLEDYLFLDNESEEL